MLQLDIFIVLAQLINFWILYYIFKTFIAEKLNIKLEERKLQLKKLKTADEYYEQKMALAKQEKEAMIKEARKTTNVLMKESENVAKKKAEIIMKRAHKQALAILDGEKRDIEKERLSMLAHMKEHIIDVSLRLNEKMFGQGKTSREFLERELEKMK